MPHFSRAQEALAEDEEQRHAADAERRVQGVPHAHPLNTLNSSRSGVAFGLHESSTAVPGGIDARGQIHPTVKAKLALSDGGTPRLNERVLASMTAGAQEPTLRQYLTIAQVAELRDVSHDVVRQDCLSKKLHASRMGLGYKSHYRISLPALKNYLTLLGESEAYILGCMADAEAMVAKRG